MTALWKKAAAAALLLGSGLVEAQETTVTTTASASQQTTVTTTVTTTASSSSASCATLTPSYDAPVAAEGWKAQLIATGLTKPRGIKFDSNGGLLVIEAGVGLRRLTFTDNGGTCLSLKGNTSVITDDELNHGLELSEDGKTLYVSSDENVDRYSYNPDTATIGNMTRLVANMSHTGGGHSTRTLLLSKKQPDLLLVSRGSASNIDLQAADETSGVSQIRAFNISNATSILQRPYSYPTDGLLVAWGLRNSVGVAEHPTTGGIYSVENSADNIVRQGVDIHEDNPGEELNFHGLLNDTSALGANYGYPACFALWNTSAPFPALNNLTVGSPFSLTPDNATINDTTCAQRTVPPRLTFQAHTAPLDIKFAGENGGEAYISFHGSWNRDHPVGYKLSYVSFSSSTNEPVEAADSTTAVKDVLTAPDVGRCAEEGFGCFRPVGIAVDAAEGRVFVSSDATGEIWVVVRDGEGQGGAGETTTGTGTAGQGPTRTGSGAPVSSTSTAAAAAVVRKVGGGWGVVAALTVGMVAGGGLVF